MRICLDLQHLKKQMFLEYFHLPTFEEIISRVPGEKIFSIIDADKAFWQIRLSEGSSKLTTFNIPFGRFCTVSVQLLTFFTELFLIFLKALKVLKYIYR